ncbi:MAG TPA: ATP-dependent helicase, partial [Actinomycetota bacterium]|nr:ATP-dependent helicase [Actinomycetota bacterium]
MTVARAGSVPAEIVAAMGGAPPTNEQWRAISMPLEPTVLIAGAGSGKTSVIAARIVYLALAALGRVDAPAGVLPGNVLALTFTVKATDNLRSRIRRALAGLDLATGDEPEIVNYHALAAQVIERYGMLTGIERGRVLSQAQRVSIAGRVLDEMSFDHVKTEWQQSVVDKILNLDAQIANHLVDPDDVVAFVTERLPVFKQIARTDRVYFTALERLELAKAVAVFRRLKRDLGVIDFGDQIELAVQVATTHPEVGQAYRDRFAAVLLDEYQDTNVAQAKLMRGMFAGGHPVTAVGDPDQNIYAWRGASLSNLFDFPTDFPKADGSPAERLPLFTNFRSGARILHAADTIISPLPAAQRPDPDKRLVPFGPNGEGEVTVTSHRDELTEARAIADRIEALHASGDSSWSEVAVLCRTSRLFFLL